MNMEQVRRLAELEDEKSDLERRLKRVKSEIADVEPVVRDEMAQEGVQSINVGDRTVYLHRQLWARPRDGDYASAVEALREVGLDEYVEEKFNVHSLSAVVREWDRNDEEVPEELAKSLEITEDIKVRSQRRS